ncbi:MAG: metal-dependent hydrolase [Desulfovibrio sp.]|nr:metal-dependent hydrolase [Desulfovibrio sp.]|tara:strand:- start:20504 stop:21769 length:1266 start_codon:yes stop_codon:yes gene_type:complete
MQRIAIDKLEPGMILGEDLTTEEGRMLLPRGAMLTSGHIRTCRVWGIPDAVIQGEEEENDGYPDSFDQIDPEVLDACKIMAAQRFVLNPSTHPAVKQMAKLYVLHQSRGLDADQARWMLTATPHDDSFAFYGEEEEERVRIRPDEVVKEELKLATLPDVVTKIVENIDNPSSSAAYISEIISRDVALSAKLLKVVNTPFYGFASKIDTLSRAVTIVGTRQLTNLALGISVINSFADIPEEFFTLKEFWLHSITCGIVARLLADEAGLEGGETFFVGGLLHDIGRLVMLKNHPEASTNVLRPAKTGRRALVEVERTIWGCTHADIAGKLLQSWRLPVRLQAMVANHHSPMASSTPREAAVIHVADFITHGIGIGSSGCSLVPVLNAEAWMQLGLPESAIKPITRKAERQAHDVMTAFFGQME